MSPASFSIGFYQKNVLKLIKGEGVGSANVFICCRAQVLYRFLNFGELSAWHNQKRLLRNPAQIILK